MPIETTRDQGQNITKHVVKGSVSEEEMYSALEDFYAHEPTLYLLWDMSQAELEHVTPDILKKFCKRAVELGKRRQNGRTAVITPGDLQYGLGRMSEVFFGLDSAPFNFKAFRSQKDALTWLMAAADPLGSDQAK